MSPDVHALTGAYVLDAVSDLERAAFERHIAECDACAQEVRELRGTAARLGQAATAEPPAWMKSQVLAKISDVRQVGREVAPGRAADRSPRDRLALRLTTVAAAVLLVASAVLGVLLVQRQDTLEDTRAQVDSISGVLTADDATLVSRTGAGGSSANAVVSRSQGKVLVFARDMPSLPDNQVYQAWLQGSDEVMHSAGLLPRASSAQLTLDLGTSTAFGITIEPAGGSPEPTQPPVMLVDFPV